MSANPIFLLSQVDAYAQLQRRSIPLKKRPNARSYLAVAGVLLGRADALHDAAKSSMQVDDALGEALLAIALAAAHMGTSFGEVLSKKIASLPESPAKLAALTSSN